MARKAYALDENDARDFNRMRRSHRAGSIPKARRMPRRRHSGGGGGNNVSVTGVLAGSWTTTEYDAVSGEPILTYNRSRSRVPIPSADYDVMVTSTGQVFTNGSTNINADNGIGVLFGGSTGSIVWKSDRNGLTAPTSLDATYNSSTAAKRSQKHVIEAADGYLWVGAIGAVYRINPTTGVMTHRIATTSTVTEYLLACPTSGSVIAWKGASSSSDQLSILDSTGARTHGFSSFVVDDAYEYSGKILVVKSNDRIASLNANDLSVISDPGSATPATMSTVITGCHDGTTAWIMTNTAGTNKIRAFAMTDLATELWNGNATVGSDGCIKYNPNNGYLYTLSTTTSLRKLDPTTGAVQWTYALPGVVGTAQSARFWFDFGSDFVVITNVGGTASANVSCLEDSTGAVRWTDHRGSYVTESNSAYGYYAGGVHVTSDDRVFVSHSRVRA